MSDEGFSLVELLVVLLILGILLAVAIPTFLGTTGAADDRSAQSDLVTAFTDAKAIYQDSGQTYGVGPGASAALVTSLGKSQLNLQFKAGSLGPNITAGSSSVQSDISVSVASDGSGVVLAAYSVPGNCFYVVDNSEPLVPAVAGVTPYLGTPVSTTSHTVSGSIGLPTSAGTSYVTVSGDQNEDDCNAFTPNASGAGILARSQSDGFPAP